MRAERLDLGGFAANCYVLSDGKTAAVVDPGADSSALRRFVEETSLDIKYILLTHGHFDHIGGVAFLKSRFPQAQIAIGKEDGFMPLSAEGSLAALFGAEHTSFTPDILLDDGDELSLGELKIKAMHTPGHTRGGMVYLAEDIAFCGDTLFNMSIGRCDFPGSSMEQMRQSLKKLSTLPAETKLYSGHGESSTLGYELKYNPFLREEI